MVIKQKILINLPLLFLEVIDELVEQNKFKNRTDFILEAIKYKIKKEGIELTPKEFIKLQDWWDDST